MRELLVEREKPFKEDIASSIELAASALKRLPLMKSCPGIVENPPMLQMHVLKDISTVLSAALLDHSTPNL